MDNFYDKLESPEESLERRIGTLNPQAMLTPEKSIEVPENFSDGFSDRGRGKNVSTDESDKTRRKNKTAMMQIKADEQNDTVQSLESKTSVTDIVAKPKNLIEMIGRNESNLDYRPKENPFGYLGKYQFGGAALEDAGYKKNGKWTGKDGIKSKEDFLLPKNDHIQEEIMREHTSRNRSTLIKKGAEKYVGTYVNGYYVTMEGMIATAHLLGATGAMKMVEGDFTRKDGFGTSGWKYMEMANRTFGIEAHANSKVAESSGFGLGVEEFEQDNWVSYREQMQMEKDAKKRADGVLIGEKIAAVVDNRWISNSAARYFAKQNRDIAPDPEWELTMEDKVGLARNYGEREMKLLNSAVSEQDLNYKKFDIEQNRERAIREQQVGLGYSLLVEAIDPASILLSIFTAGAYKVNQASRLGNAAKTGGLVSIEESAVEAFKVQQDTSKSWNDIYIAAATSYVIGGAIGSLRKGQNQVVAEEKLLFDQRERMAKVVRDKAQLQAYRVEKEKLLSRLTEDGSYRTKSTDTEMKVLDANAAFDGFIMNPARVATTEMNIRMAVVKMDEQIAARQADIDRADSYYSGSTDDILTRSQKKAVNKSKKEVEEDYGKTVIGRKEDLEAMQIMRRDELGEFGASRGVATDELQVTIRADQVSRIQKKWDKDIAKADKKWQEELTEIDNHRLELETKLRNSEENIKAQATIKSNNNDAISFRNALARDNTIAAHDKGIEASRIIIANNQDLLTENARLISAKAEMDKVNAMTPDQQTAHFKDDLKIEDIASMEQVKADLAELNIKMKKLEKEMEETYLSKAEKEEASRAKEQGVDIKVNQQGPANGGSVGAMRADPVEVDAELFPSAADNIPSIDEAVMESAMTRYVAHLNTNGKNWTKFIPDWLLSDYTRVNQSDDMGIQSLNHLLLDNPQLGDAHTVSTLVSLNESTIRMAGQNSMDRGFDLHLSEDLKMNTLTGHVLTKHREEFEKSVAMAIKGVLDEDALTDAIKMSRDGMRNLFKTAGALRKLHREKGFEDLESFSTYLPDMMSHHNILKMNDDGWDADDIVNLIAKGYETGGAGLTRRQAKAIAHIKYDNISRGFLSGEDIQNVFRADRITDAKRLMNDANVPQNIIDDFFTDIFAKEDWDSISKRARKSLFIDWKAEHTNPRTGQTVKISDIMETNVSKLSEAYTIESSFGAALAEKGIKSEAQLYRMMDSVEKQAMNSSNNKAQVRKHMAILKKTIPQLKGRSIVDYSNPLNKAGRVLLDSTAMLRLQQVGFASIPEFARIMSELGVIETLKAVKASGMFRAPAWRNKSLSRDAQNKLKKEFQAEMENIEEMIGYIGEADFNRSWNVRSDDLGSEMTNGFTKSLDSALEGGRRIGSWLSLHQTVQGGLSKVSALGTSRRLLKAFNGSQKLPRSLERQIRMTGMSKERFNEIAAFIKANPAKADFHGRSIPTWNKKAMEDADKALYSKRDALLEEADVVSKSIGKLQSRIKKAKASNEKDPSKAVAKQMKKIQEDLDILEARGKVNTEKLLKETSKEAAERSDKKVRKLMEKSKEDHDELTAKKEELKVASKHTDIISLESELFDMKEKLGELQIKANEPIQSIKRDVQVLLQRLNNRSVLKGNVGEMNTNWLGPFGRFLTQFKTFSLNSLEKQLIADMRGDVASFPVKFMYGTGMAYAAYMAQMHLRALGMDDREAEAYLKKQTEGKNLYWGVFNKHSQLAALGVVSDIGVFSGVAPKEMYDGTRYGYVNSNVDSAVASLGVLKDAVETVGAAGDVVGSLTGVGSKSTSDALDGLKKEGTQLLPYGNTIVLGEYLKNITK